MVQYVYSQKEVGCIDKLDRQIERYNRGVDALYAWIVDIKYEYSRGRTVNKTQYNKILYLHSESKRVLEELIQKRNSGRFDSCRTSTGRNR